ncbi:MAG: DUF488 domain-containing protein [Crinalium sp.]
MELFTIGHSNHSLEAFLALLKKHNITAIADVRSYPYSRYLPHFNQKELQEALANENISYVFLGRELGARPKNLECYVNGKALYEKIAATAQFKTGIQRVIKGVDKYRVSLMCAEKDPMTCHRSILVCQYLRQFKLSISHILKDGDLEFHHDLENRMLAKHGFTKFSEKQEVIQLSLFEFKQLDDLPTKEECLHKAYKIQGDEIAYVEKGKISYEQAN